jgi:diphthine synthase
MVKSPDPILSLEVTELKELIFVGLGLNDEKGISLQGLEETRKANAAFMERYTNLLPDFSLQRFEAQAGKKITQLTRHDLEDANGEAVLSAAENGTAVLLVPGDPFVATTHVALRLAAEKRGIKTRIVPGASAISAVIGACGLHNYKFGKTVTVPFPENASETPYNVIAQNKSLGLHTLCLLDLKTDENRFLSVSEALKELLAVEDKKREGILTRETLVVGTARIGSATSIVKADLAARLLTYDFGGPPQSLIVPGELHFMEIEALIQFAGAPTELRRMTK